MRSALLRTIMSRHRRTQLPIRHSPPRLTRRRRTIGTQWQPVWKAADTPFDKGLVEAEELITAEVTHDDANHERHTPIGNIDAFTSPRHPWRSVRPGTRP